MRAAEEWFDEYEWKVNGDVVGMAPMTVEDIRDIQRDAFDAGARAALASAAEATGDSQCSEEAFYLIEDLDITKLPGRPE